MKRSLLEKIMIPVAIALAAAGVKLWSDVEILKARLNYVVGSNWTVPK